MRTKIYLLIFVALLGFAMLTLQACFEPADPYWTPGRQAHEQREWQWGPRHTVCDPYGNNCVVCDADNDYCRRPYSSFGPYSQWDVR
jgi:hypothetical protein